MKQLFKLFNIKDAFKINLKVNFGLRDLFKISLFSDNPGSRQRSDQHHHNSNNQTTATGTFVPLRIAEADRQAAIAHLSSLPVEENPWALRLATSLSARGSPVAKRSNSPAQTGE